MSKKPYNEVTDERISQREGTLILLAQAILVRNLRADAFGSICDYDVQGALDDVLSITDPHNSRKESE